MNPRKPRGLMVFELFDRVIARESSNLDQTIRILWHFLGLPVIDHLQSVLERSVFGIGFMEKIANLRGDPALFGQGIQRLQST